MSGLKEKAKTLNELLWENRLEWDKWLRMGVTEQKQIELAPKYQEKWVKLEDAQQEIEKIHRKYETLISKAEKDCADCYQELKQKLQQVVKEIPSCIDCEYYLGDEEGNGHCSLSEQQHVDSVCCLKDKFLNELPKKFKELLKEEKQR
jgi:hypothetical protein